ncbi:hypothetical protein VB151_19910 [Xanthomonas fragariae]|uniref:Uncharacterized protein n=1 Tax=Xanthomonas fragariae TaxID=48664 RepID=A0A1Y6HA88_9XANT|nr:hypothetical protein [Xanthomonas fragariae]MBL9221034.1 hypothetical protein [Xanthomonas fragariae]MEA5175709.1 hypothetical protein [Xanthomonas fragariae]MEA5188336.1 hypothetical protein [Xanthomonas fragariae]MEA5200284.1 hypothetical protein [Xanthomonas fragariae]MEA5212563.1 hypothetical protein [Xanthomonas fragariae]
MHDTTRSIRTSDLAALAQATDATGQVDLTAYQGYRLMKAHQTLERVMNFERGWLHFQASGS